MKLKTNSNDTNKIMDEKDLLIKNLETMIKDECMMSNIV
eukprot:CAMPEP_0116936902 /NCGR_PEP_ID=MMETSP0467-20121206/31170_1 /TAXON_ID=283647 /ORGANISM="Mesodinium pulex, Strain SPMC105" /LENGTH=38 /DNA_ID= /DNA_START= /DNA_END= /DNA_ORIENTATION=